MANFASGAPAIIIALPAFDILRCSFESWRLFRRRPVVVVLLHSTAKLPTGCVCLPSDADYDFAVSP